MWLTEEQAKRTWCPHARVVQADVLTVAFNRAVITSEDKKSVKEVINAPLGAKCCATECAAWRWENDNELREIDLTTGQVPDRRGYCGLAGRPCS